MSRIEVERQMQLARAQLQLGAARRARHAHLLAVASAHRIDLDPIPVDDELAVANAIARIQSRGGRLDPAVLNIPTPEQILAGQPAPTQGGHP